MRSWKQRFLVTGRPCNSCIYTRIIALVSTVSRGWPLPTKPTPTFAQTCAAANWRESQLLFPSVTRWSITNTAQALPFTPPQHRILSQKGAYSTLLPAAGVRVVAMSMYSQNNTSAMAPPQKPETFMLSDSAQQNLPQDAQVALQQVDNRELLQPSTPDQCLSVWRCASQTVWLAFEKWH